MRREGLDGRLDHLLTPHITAHGARRARRIAVACFGQCGPLPCVSIPLAQARDGGKTFLIDRSVSGLSCWRCNPCSTPQVPRFLPRPGDDLRPPGDDDLRPPGDLASSVPQGKRPAKTRRNFLMTTQAIHPLSPRLAHCPDGLPRAAYLDADWFAREMTTIFARHWVMVGRLKDIAPGTMRRVRVGAAEVVLCRSAEGDLSAFHNQCRHRGAELCRGEVEPLGRLLSCPYHAWAYAVQDGRLVSTAFAKPTDDFLPGEHGLLPLALKVWAGFVLLSAADTPPDICSDVPLTTLDNWPMEHLVTGHRHSVELACNWKVFWENYSECLHCPGIHPELSDLVPVYRKGLMAAPEALGWTPDAREEAHLKPGSDSWTLTGTPCGPVFAGLSAKERAAGHSFVTLWPSAYVVAHVDYVRAVRLIPVAPERTRLIAEWYFAPETLARPGFDAAEVAAFAKIVLAQDTEAAEMTQRGMTSPTFIQARLMPEEYEIHRFQQWILNEMENPS